MALQLIQKKACHVYLRHWFTPTVAVTNSKRNIATKSRCFSIYEPPEINVKPEIPEYETLWLKIQGRDFALLESYEKYLKRLMKTMDITVSNSWPSPTMKFQQTVFALANDKKDHQSSYSLHMYQYERVIEMADIPNTTATVLFEAVHQNLPEGIDMVVQEPDTDEKENRFVPLRIIDAYKKQMDDLDQKHKNF